MPFLRPTRSTLFSRIQADFDANLPGTDSRLRRSNTGVLAKVWGIALDYVYGFLSWIALQLFPSTAAEEFVMRAASLWLSTPRYDAQVATGSVTVIATQVVIITRGHDQSICSCSCHCCFHLYRLSIKLWIIVGFYLVHHPLLRTSQVPHPLVSRLTAILLLANLRQLQAHIGHTR